MTVHAPATVYDADNAHDAPFDIHHVNLEQVLPDAMCQRRAARFCRNVLAKVPQRRRGQVAGHGV